MPFTVALHRVFADPHRGQRDFVGKAYVIAFAGSGEDSVVEAFAWNAPADSSAAAAVGAFFRAAFVFEIFAMVCSPFWFRNEP